MTPQEPCRILQKELMGARPSRPQGSGPSQTGSLKLGFAERCRLEIWRLVGVVPVCPGGTRESSPAIYRRVQVQFASVPAGRLNSPASSIPKISFFERDAMLL
jgi:hypothetical protein